VEEHKYGLCFLLLVTNIMFWIVVLFQLQKKIVHGECHVVSVTDPYGRILGFLDRNRYFFFQAAPQLYS
jgi:hypothetical protein